MSAPVIGLTGGIACGKSRVSAWLSQQGAAIVDADLIAHELAQPGGALYQCYVEHFGNRILQADGSLDRRAVGGIVFNDAEERRWLDSASHPLIYARLLEEKQQALSSEPPAVVLDVPLLFEAGWEEASDETWLVCLPVDLQLQRLCRRDDCSQEEAWARIRAQMPLEAKMLKADVCIDNSGRWNRTRRILKDLWRKRIDGEIS